MVPIPQAQHDGYLPPLDQCISGRRRLISWKLAFAALCDKYLTDTSPALRAFLLDPATVDILAQGLDQDAPNAPAIGKDLDSRLGLLQGASDRGKSFDTKQFKDDAVWLSQQTKVDELSALRLVVLEWQDRAATRLLQDYSEEERLSLQQALNVGALGASRGQPLQDADATTDFLSEARRRERLLLLYLADKEALLAVNVYLASMRCSAMTEPSVARHSPWLISLVGSVQQTRTAKEKRLPVQARKDYIPGCINAMQTCLINFENGSGWSVPDEAAPRVEEVFREGQITNLAHLLRLLFLHMATTQDPDTPSSVQGWFSFIDEYGFFMQLPALSPLQQDTIESIQALTSLISLKILKLPYTLDYLNSGTVTQQTPLPSVLDISCQKQINDTLFRAAEYAIVLASPAILAWSIILQTLRGQVGSSQADLMSDDEPSLVEDGSPTLSRQVSRTLVAPREFTLAIRNVMNTRIEEDPIQYLAKSAVNVCQVFGIVAQLSQVLHREFSTGQEVALALQGRLALFELVQQCVLVVDYSNELLDVVHSLLNIKSFPGRSKIDVEALHDSLIEFFINDDNLLMPGVFLQAQSRYPYEIKPFLRLCRSLSSSGDANRPQFTDSLSTLSQFTQIMPRDFTAYELVREDENANSIRLTENLYLFKDKRAQYPSQGASSQATALTLAGSGSEFYIPRGTIGVVISESKPFVVIWGFRHSGLQYLATLLSTSLPNAKQTEAALQRPLDKDVQADIIGLIATQISTTFHSNPGRPQQERIESSLRILEEASDGLGRNEDIISTVAEIFEGELLQQSRSSTEVTTELLVACTQFLKAVLEIMPGRVWPVISRCDLLDVEGSGGRLSAIVASIEIVVGRYDFLYSSLELFEALVTDTLAHALERRGSGSPQQGRFTSGVHSSAGLTDRMLSKILKSFVKMYLDVFQSYGNWKFVESTQRDAITIVLLRSFSRILTVVFGFDDSQPPESKITSTLAPAAGLIRNAFLADSANASQILKCLLRTCAGDADLSAAAVLTRQTSLQLLTNLLRISILSKTTSPASYEPVLKAMPVFARLYTSCQPLRLDLCSMFTELALYLSTITGEPPSLLGCLSPSSATDFVEVIQDVAMPLQDTNLECSVWRFLETVVSTKQQWLATFVLVGGTPRTILQTKKAGLPAKNTKPLFRVALDELASTGTLQNSIAIARLQFVAAAQNYWSWTTHTIAKETKFIQRLVAHVSDLESEDTTDAEMSDDSQYVHAISIIAQILAMYLHNSRLVGSSVDSRSIGVRLIAYYRTHAVAVPSYSSSLHGHLQKNFEKTFAGCSLQSFKRVLKQSHFGPDYFYDLDFAKDMLSFHGSWSGARGSGFHDEFVRANRNLSLVEAQILQFKGWKCLATELSANMAGDKALHAQMVGVVERCLKSNTASALPEKIFSHLLLSRADLALIIIQRLVADKADVKGMKTILPVVWTTIRGCGQNFDLAFVGDSTPYYRTLLKIMLLAMQPYAYMKAASTPETSLSSSMRDSLPDISAIILETVTNVISKGFHSLATTLHESPKDVHPSDLGLLIALLQTVLRLDGVHLLHSQIALRLCDANAGRHATALFSWSDQFTAEDDDPVFGELSISFLVDMSSIQPMAEFLAVEGVLSQLSTANIMRNYRHGRGVGSLDAPQRLHVIWSRGVLPLCLNLLIAIGESFAVEVAAFLNGFEPQLRRSEGCLDTKATTSRHDASAGRLTLNAATELHTLALLLVILDRFRLAPAASAVGEIAPLLWDGAAVKADLESWLNGRRMSLKDRIVATTEQEVQMARLSPLAKESAADNRLEEKVLAELTGALACLNGGV